MNELPPPPPKGPRLLRTVRDLAWAGSETVTCLRNPASIDGAPR